MKMKATISIDSILWKQFKKNCIEHDKKYSQVICNLIADSLHNPPKKVAQKSNPKKALISGLPSNLNQKRKQHD